MHTLSSAMKGGLKSWKAKKDIRKQFINNTKRVD